MARCIRCNRESILISSELGVCLDCIRSHFDEVKSAIQETHRRSREEFRLPPEPPRKEDGLACDICVNQCLVGEGERGYCGVRVNTGGRFEGAGSDKGNLSWYHDPLPTNCVADWVCPGGSECGYPEFSHSQAAEYGYKNLAVFFNSCTFNCLYCQNWQYRRESTKTRNISIHNLVRDVTPETSCICYFGGDPASQLPFALKASRKALDKAKDRILRVCWETNGSMNPLFLEEMADISLKSGGCIKFDLKAWHEEVNFALCGSSNIQTEANFKLLAERIHERPSIPFLVASTLLVPGYVDEEEVAGIAKFIASLDPDIPYALLAFSPHFYMHDLPRTSSRHARRCKEIALDAGLKKVKIGNVHLLGEAY